jgi:hypothetical protein
VEQTTTTTNQLSPVTTTTTTAMYQQQHQQHQQQQSLEQQLTVIDAEIDRLTVMRNQVIVKAALAEELEAMRGKGKMMSDIVLKAAMIMQQQQQGDLGVALMYVNAFLLPWRHYISSAHFPNTVETLPDEIPFRGWTRADLSTFLIDVSRAVERDRAVLREMSFE